MTAVWAGTWVAGRLGVDVRGHEAGPYGDLRELVGLALRRNPRRAHLLVSTVLAKHWPQVPARVHGSGLELGARVADVLGRDAGEPVVLGYAETATGLGHCVAEALGATYLHSTRREVAGVRRAGGFEEQHSHATTHLLLPGDADLLARPGPLVLVDDELSTGQTLLNTVADLHARHPRERYVVASLVDVRGAHDRERMAEFARRLGVRVDVVSLASGTVVLPEGVLEAGAELVAGTREFGNPEGPVGDVRRIRLPWPHGVPDGGRHGFTPAHQAALDAALPKIGAELAASVRGPRVLVLGTEELMYVPLRIAGALGDAAPGLDVRFSTTTRSPVLAVDDPGYAIRTRLVFAAHDNPADGPGERYAYNVAPGADAARGFDDIVVVTDTAGDTPELHGDGGLVEALRRVTPRVGLVVLPATVLETAV